MSYVISSAPVAVTTAPARADWPRAYRVNVVREDSAAAGTGEGADLMTKSIRKVANELTRVLQATA